MLWSVYMWYICVYACVWVYVCMCVWKCRYIYINMLDMYMLKTNICYVCQAYLLCLVCYIYILKYVYYMHVHLYFASEIFITFVLTNKPFEVGWR